jgi:hypothetical protein
MLIRMMLEMLNKNKIKLELVDTKSAWITGQFMCQQSKMNVRVSKG